jgi:hypothetical protein
MDWKTLATLLGLGFAASWATIIPIVNGLWSKIVKVKQDYDKAVADGVITDAEKVVLLDDIMAAMTDAVTIFQFVSNLVLAILSAIKRARLHARQGLVGRPYKRKSN